jgi:hypothetical protein
VFATLLVVGIAGAILIRPASPARLRPGPPRAALPEGMIELVALSRHPTDGRWWDPDGALATEGPFEVLHRSFPVPPGEKAIEVVLRTHGLPPGASTPTCFFEGMSGAGSGGEVKVQGRAVPGALHYTVLVPQSLERTTVRADVALDPWTTLARTGGTGTGDISLMRDGRPIKVRFLGAEAKRGGTVLKVAHDPSDQDVRVVAVTADGTERPSLLLTWAGPHIEAEWVDLPRGQIREFQLQTRPYRRAEFRNVALGPRNTDAGRGPGHAGHPVAGTPESRPGGDAGLAMHARLKHAELNEAQARAALTALERAP